MMKRTRAPWFDTGTSYSTSAAIFVIVMREFVVGRCRVNDDDDAAPRTSNTKRCMATTTKESIE